MDDISSATNRSKFWASSQQLSHQVEVFSNNQPLLSEHTTRTNTNHGLTSQKTIQRVIRDIRARRSLSTTAPETTPINSVAISKKRSFIDLTSDDKSSTKISRSSSYSTEAEEEIIHELQRTPVADSTNAKFREKPQPAYTWLAATPPSKPLSSARIPSQQHASAVIVRSRQLSPAQCRQQVLENLKQLSGGITVSNSIDDSSPPLDFRFLDRVILGSGVSRVSDDFMNGCKCRKDNGRNVGCEYLSCECLDDSETHTETGKRVFPYAAGRNDFKCLRNFYLESRNHIYECNSKCNCEDNCKNRVVQHGRSVKLDIFKTTNRGWGLRPLEDLKTGQFIDTYRGEIITEEECNNRGTRRTADHENYFFDLDKFSAEKGPDSAAYVCDGMYMGGPTRFINHSCDPNCRLFTVSYNHADLNIYDLAFFAAGPIKAGTELTFDYTDSENREVITDEMADEKEKEKGYRPARCSCGTAACRGYFFD